MAKYQTKPTVVDAVRFDPHQQPWPRDMSWGYILTHQGQMHVYAGDWIITDSQGEKHHCSADIFTALYEPVREVLE